MTATILERSGDQLGDFLPGLAGALVLALVGLFVAALLGRLTRAALIRLKVDDGAERIGLSAILERAGLGDSLAKLVGRAVRISVSVVVLFAALSLLGLAFLSQSLNEGVLFIPRVLTALVLLLAGLVLGALVGQCVERTSAQMDLPLPLAPIAQAVVIIFFGITAAAQVGVAIAPLMLVVTVGLIAVTATLALAFGLGSQQIARSLTATRYARADFAVGQTIRIGDLRGRIIRIESTATVLRNGQDEVRIPNHVLIEGVVIIETSGDTL